MGRERPRACSASHWGVTSREKGSRPDLFERRGRRSRREDQHLAETPDVLVDEFQAVFQLKDQVDVRQGREGFGLRAQEQMAGHAQVHQQGDAALQGKDQVFAPAA